MKLKPFPWAQFPPIRETYAPPYPTSACWGFVERSFSSPSLGERRGRERLHGVDHNRLELWQEALWGERLQEELQWVGSQRFPR